MKGLRQILFVALSSLGFCPAFAAVGGVEMMSDYTKAREALVESEEKQRQIMSALFDINKSTKRLVTERAKTENERLVLEGTTKELAQKILELESRIKSQRSLLQVRLGAIYKLGGQGLARIIFSSKSSADLERNLKILGQIAKHDLGLVKDYTKSAAELSTKQQRFLNRLSQLRRVEKKIAKQEEAIGREARQKAKVLDSIRRSKSSALAKIQSIRQQSSKLAGNADPGSDELLDLLLRPSFYEKKGELRWPVMGRVSRTFGLVKSSQFDVVLNNKGIGIGATPGAEVVSIFPGRVSYQGSLDGWGPTLIVDHGDHYYSVYSNLGGVFVQKGDEVLEGQKIAQATSEVYFEIRHFSEPYNPVAWMKGQHQ